ncbi:hypothetical protein Pogu_0618 [Pyrobaculum oguniense TE7]|uniref:Uncharacterized protein n=1 Tax=Pyrobaculum oguniense (strain DSM 13380 / JCM 10595 / TE7) TaxID=698757 RepID=H6Q7Y8_PYROT|nr:hypothetical protein Pogu_0618 [Pyrobaculum oguniense TE7]
MNEVLKEILLKQKRELERLKKEGWRFHIPPPKPAKWRPVEIPLVKLAKALDITYKRPEYWDLCRDLENPLKCYRLLVKRLRDKELFSAFLQALMSGGDVKTVVELVEKGDKKGLEEYTYSRFMK